MKRSFVIMVVTFTLGFAVAGCGSSSETAKESNTAVMSENSTVTAQESRIEAAQESSTEAAQESSTVTAQESSIQQAEETKYKDGVYEGKSDLTSEGYYGTAKVTIKNGEIGEVYFEIFDTSIFKTYGNSKHKDAGELLLDETYKAEVYEDVPAYQEQTANELEGMKKYKSELIQKQDVDEVDGISGATWSYKIFKETMKNTLEKADK